MNHAHPIFRPHQFCLAACALLISASTTTLFAQSAPTAPESSVAGMSQDVQELQRTVSQLTLRLEALEQDNQRLQKQIPSSQDLKTMIQNAVAENRAANAKDLAQATADLRKELSADEAQHLEALTKEFNAQLKKLADAIAEKPVAVAPPIKRTPLPPDTKGETYTVKRGDSLAKIAQLYKVSSSDILNANAQISDPSKLREGQTLFIPLKDGAVVTPLPATIPGK